jgi:hypothetical protein
LRLVALACLGTISIVHQYNPCDAHACTLCPALWFDIKVMYDHECTVVYPMGEMSNG